MANERQRRLMQEALDGRLSSEAMQELYARIDRNPDEAADFHKLKQVDQLLRAAPMERAPQGLALKIMARLAEGLQPEQLKRTSGLALAIGLALVTLLLTPLLAGLGWLLLSAIGNAGVLSSLIGQVVTLLGMVMNTLDALVQGAKAVLETYPEAPALMIALIPIALFWLVRFAWQSRNLEES